MIKTIVIGLGGGGSNAVSYMFQNRIEQVEYWIANTDLSALKYSGCTNMLLLGKHTTRGLGAGGNPEVGKAAALEGVDEIRNKLHNADIVFVSVCLGGGTGTGAAPVVCKIAKELGSLVICVATLPFSFEGKRRNEYASTAVKELLAVADSVLLVSNNKLLEVIGRIPLVKAFHEADKVLVQSMRMIVDLVSTKSLINLDFADIKATMKGQGLAHIGIGIANGENRAREAAQQAISSPLLEMKVNDAKHAIIHVTGNTRLRLEETELAVLHIQSCIKRDIDIIFGVAINEQLLDEIIVSVILAGVL